LRDSAHAARSDPRCGTKCKSDAVQVLLDIVTCGQHERVARILARQYPCDGEPLRKQCRHIFAAVNGEVDLAGEQRILNFLHEQAFAPYLG
jgi:hypothetical protein